MSAPHLVLGATGQVGRALTAQLAAAGVAVVGTGFSRAADLRLNLEDHDGLRAVLDAVRPETVWIVGAYTHVDGCEQDPARSARVNREAPAIAAAWAQAHGARPVLFSTDYVFDGEAGPYGESDPVAPLSVYGRDKAAAEAAVAAVPGGMVLRTAWVYSWEPEPAQNFCQRLVGNLAAGRTARLPDDQWGNPTYAPDLARSAVDLAAAGADGIWHVAGPRVMSRYAFGLAIAEAWGLDPGLVHPAPTVELGQPARRPLQAGLRVDRLQRSGAFRPRPPDVVLPLLATGQR
jgi:dTDP-4-dehydrorhamnose reductase